MKKIIIMSLILTGVAMSATNKSTCDNSINAGLILKRLVLNHQHEVISGVDKILTSYEYALPYCIKAYGKNSKTVKALKHDINVIK